MLDGEGGGHRTLAGPLAPPLLAHPSMPTCDDQQRTRTTNTALRVAACPPLFGGFFFFFCYFFHSICIS
ncbi:hypothetical protein CKAH01_05990 [Colletotrichum kahawae]|uniref:Uncharacterized protein n=1 Tax=Colletotrichum kahawae TaxID=34407 RepID=A0AAE0D4L7_COLKA|nr:hypothetical protein CKAH01_05990 [Colletotrichum kahawae]